MLRPDCPKARRFLIAFCDDPNCGVHLIAEDKDGAPIVEIVTSPEQTLLLIEQCKKHLYDKATRKH